MNPDIEFSVEAIEAEGIQLNDIEKVAIRHYEKTDNAAFVWRAIA